MLTLDCTSQSVQPFWKISFWNSNFNINQIKCICCFLSYNPVWIKKPTTGCGRKETTATLSGQRWICRHQVCSQHEPNYPMILHYWYSLAFFRLFFNNPSHNTIRLKICKMWIFFKCFLCSNIIAWEQEK